MKILLINLDRSKDRLEEQNIQFKRLGLTFERLSAVSIHDFSEADYKKMAFGAQRPMKQSELACFLSHKKAWEYVLKLKEPCVILEDDAVLVKDFNKILDDVTGLTQVDYINLEVHGRKKLVAKEARYSIVNDSYKLLKIFMDRSGTGGYILYPSGAKVLLEFMKRRNIGLSDEFIHSCYELNAFQIEPAALLQSDKCEMYGVDTDIDKGSIIGQVKNSVNFELSKFQKISFRFRRILGQIILGIRYLQYTPQGVKREIKVRSSNF